MEIGHKLIFRFYNTILLTILRTNCLPTCLKTYPLPQFYTTKVVNSKSTTNCIVVATKLLGCYVEAFAKFAKVRCTQNTASNIRLVDVVASLNVLHASQIS